MVISHFYILFGLNTDYMHYWGLLSYSNSAITVTSKRRSQTNLRANSCRVRARPSTQEGHTMLNISTAVKP